MKDYYKKLEKKRYARAAILRKHDGDPAIMGYQGRNIFMICCRKLRKAMKYFHILRDDKFYIGQLSVVVDFKCNLNCDGCGQHMPLLKEMPSECKQVDMEQIYRDLDKISDAVDGIGGIGVGNGEGFLFSGVIGLIDYYARNPKILNMNIPTNGSVLPAEEVLKKMRDNKVSATVTKYDVIPEERRKKVTDLLTKYKIIYTVFYDRVWFLHEYLPEITSSKKEATIKYCHCERFFLLMQGKLWRCVTDATRTFVGIREERKGDSICVKDATVEEIRDFLWEKTHIPYLESCLHCRGIKGSMAKKIPAGKQLKGKD